MILTVLIALLPVLPSHPPPVGLHSVLIGYTELATDLPGGRHANVKTMRAFAVRADGSGRRELAKGLAGRPDSWTQFAGWSPGGDRAIIGLGWESPENAAWEEEHKTFRFTPEGWLYDCCLVDMKTGKPRNLTAPNRVSFYNGGLFFWPGDATKLGFTALINGDSHPFSMNLDGSEKKDLTYGASAFTYGFSSSPDGKRISYHKDYQIYIANADGSNALKIETGNPFNFGPAWSPDGRYLLFLSGEHYKCHPFVVRTDGSGLRKLGSRGSYSGSVDFLDVPDFHQGSSDVPVWSPDSKWVYFTSQVGECVELFRTAVDGGAAPEQLTHSEPGAGHYHPEPSPDGAMLLYGVRRDGVRQIAVMRLSDRHETQITHLQKGRGAMWPHWQTGKFW